MLNTVKLTDNVGALVCAETPCGGSRWYAICGGCGDMREVAKPSNPDAYDTCCTTCYEETFAAEDQRQHNQETHDFRRTMGV